MDNTFGSPFTLISNDEEDTHLEAVMCNVQAYIDHVDTEESAKAELRIALAALNRARSLLGTAMSPCPRV
jgi:hypothetical protein